MVIEPKYLTFDEYVTLGGDLQESLFKVVEYRAEKKVDLYTFNRFRRINEYPEELKMCIYELIPVLNQQFDNDSNITSESVGNYSVTRKSNTEITSQMLETIKLYLSNTTINGTPVLYIGADEN